MGIDIQIIKPIILEKKYISEIDFGHYEKSNDCDVICIKDKPEIKFWEIDGLTFIDKNPVWLDQYVINLKDAKLIAYKRSWLDVRVYDFFNTESDGFTFPELGLYSKPDMIINNIYSIKEEKQKFKYFLDILDKYEQWKLITIIW